MDERIEWIVDERRFAAVREPWSDLAETAARPFSSHEWFWHWWEAFGAGRELRVCALWRDSRLAAAFPLCETDSCLEALADSHHTPTFEPLSRSTNDLRRITDAASGFGSAELRVPCLAAGETAMHELQKASRGAKRLSLVLPMHTSPIVRTTGALDEYLATPGLKGPLHRYRRKMGREYEARFEIICEPEELEPILTDGFKLEASGWKGRAATAIVSDPATKQFYRGIAHSFRERGELRLSWIRLDGALVAFDLCVLRRDRLWLLKTAYDERYRQLAPGLVLRLSVIERCFELGLQAHELGGDSAEWKLRFANDKRSHMLLASYARRPRAALHVGWRGYARPLLGRARRALIASRHASC